MLKYFNNHSDDFVSQSEPVVVALMQLTGALFAETINIILICGQQTVMDTVLNYIALGVIAEIDNYYCNSLPNKGFKTAVLESEPLTIKYRTRSIKYKERLGSGKVIIIFYKMLRILYVTL
jgi:hypothetical protein